MLDEIKKEFGEYIMVEDDMRFPASVKAEVEKTLIEETRLPQFADEVIRVNYEDGCKVYFEDGWVICRFSGTEPLLRIFAESTTKERAQGYIDAFKEFLF